MPFFALDQDGLATENSGTVWFGTLLWSGSWKMIVEQDPNHQVRVSGGYNDYDNFQRIMQTPLALRRVSLARARVVLVGEGILLAGFLTASAG